MMGTHVGAGSKPSLVRVACVKYADPKPFSSEPSTDVSLESHRVVFQVAGIIVREDDEYLVLGEIASLSDNGAFAAKFGSDMFPAYRNVVPIRKSDVVELRIVELEEGAAGGEYTAKAGVR